MKKKRVSRLKIFRVVCGIASLLLLLSVFVLPSGLRRLVNYIQVGPAGVHASGLVSAGVLVFVVLLLITLLFGRVFCSFMCPLGVAQDGAIRLGGIFRRGNRRKRWFCYTPNHRMLRYSFAGLLIAILLAGAAVPLGLFEPYSIFGRFCGSVLHPAGIWVNNWLSDSGLLNVYPRDYKPVVMISVAIGAGMFLAVMLMAAVSGRLFCNTLCPVGAVLGIVGKYSFFRIRFADSGCVDCGMCAAACKAGCIDYANRTVDTERCISCFNCISACRPSGLRYGRAAEESGAAEVVPSGGRRDFIVAGGVAAVGAVVTGKLLARGVYQDIPIMPPGALNSRHFLSKCTGCRLCVENCPGHVLEPAVTQYGFRGFMQPLLNFDAGMCEFDCTVCSDICPTGALLPMTMEEKHTLQIGVAEFRRRLCVVRNDHTHCGACAEHCPTGAVHMVPWGGRGRHRGRGRGRGHEGLMMPQVEPELCIGCGACEHVCPVRPERAIVVNGLREHVRAEVRDESAPAGDESAPAGEFLF